MLMLRAHAWGTMCQTPLQLPQAPHQLAARSTSQRGPCLQAAKQLLRARRDQRRRQAAGQQPTHRRDAARSARLGLLGWRAQAGRAAPLAAALAAAQCQGQVLQAALALWPHHRRRRQQGDHL